LRNIGVGEIGWLAAAGFAAVFVAAGFAAAFERVVVGFIRSIVIAHSLPIYNTKAF
jgi:hypothetical protein